MYLFGSNVEMGPESNVGRVCGSPVGAGADVGALWVRVSCRISLCICTFAASTELNLQISPSFQDKMFSPPAFGHKTSNERLDAWDRKGREL